MPRCCYRAGAPELLLPEQAGGIPPPAETCTAETSAVSGGTSAPSLRRSEYPATSDLSRTRTRKRSKLPDPAQATLLSWLSAPFNVKS